MRSTAPSRRWRPLSSTIRSISPLLHFTPDEWQEKGHEYDEIRDNMLGWDITDYGQGDFDKVGFSLITLRNGNLKMRDRYARPTPRSSST